jgi:hypothetical protein
MTIEKTYFVRIAPALHRTVHDLHCRVIIARRRAQKLPPGERAEARRFEELHAAIDQCALASLWGGERVLVEVPGGTAADAGFDGSSVLDARAGIRQGLPRQVSAWLDEGAIVVRLRLPHFDGTTLLAGTEDSGPPPVAGRWSTKAERRGDAIQDRFRHLITRALAADGTPEAVIRPSEISNSVLTETLREHVVSGPGLSRSDLPVRYRDGSFGPPFPLQSLNLTSSVPDGWRVLRLTLLSIRHVEMDTVVDGAWFRNARISLPREAGLTDQLAFETSLQQLRLLVEHGPTVLHLYQTGLETAVMGFYRAVVHHLLARPGTISIVPHYFHGPGQFSEGTPWTTV